MTAGRLAFHGNPVRQLGSPGPWAATVYLVSYLPVGTLCFGVCLVVLVVSAVLNITWLGLPLLIGAAAVLRGCATVERKRAGLIGLRIEARYRPVTGTGVFTHLTTRWHDEATWRDCAYLVGLFPVLLALDVVGLAIWLVCLAGITVPAWYWSIPDGLTIDGLIRIDTVPAAIVTAVGSLVLSSLASYVVVAAARAHGVVARTVLGPYVDPLAEAKRVVAGPGPLPTL